MCSIFFSYKSHTKYRLIVAANRDEFYERPTTKAAFWVGHSDVLAGRDLKYGGTWLGVSKSGKFAAVTNYREVPPSQIGNLSRGELVSNFLIGEEDPERYLRLVQKRASRYSGFNLLVGDEDSLYYFSNRENEINKLKAGVYGLSNHLLDTPWQKVIRGKSALSVELDKEEIDKDKLFALLFDKVQAKDSDLPNTGIGIEKERVLSPVFIVSPIYGTRSSTVLLFDYDDNVTFIERTFRNGIYDGEEVSFKYKLQNRLVAV